METDFWQDEKRRAAWDEIEVGVERQTRPVELTLDTIQAYARAIGDLNPLYFDEQYAKRTVFGGLIAPPTIHVPLLFLATEVTDWIRRRARSTPDRTGITAGRPVRAMC